MSIRPLFSPKLNTQIRASGARKNTSSQAAGGTAKTQKMSGFLRQLSTMGFSAKGSGSPDPLAGSGSGRHDPGLRLVDHACVRGAVIGRHLTALDRLL